MSLTEQYPELNQNSYKQRPNAWPDKGPTPDQLAGHRWRDISDEESKNETYFYQTPEAKARKEVIDSLDSLGNTLFEITNQPDLSPEEVIENVNSSMDKLIMSIAKVNQDGTIAEYKTTRQIDDGGQETAYTLAPDLKTVMLLAEGYERVDLASRELGYRQTEHDLYSQKHLQTISDMTNSINPDIAEPLRLAIDKHRQNHNLSLMELYHEADLQITNRIIDDGVLGLQNSFEPDIKL